MRRRYLLGSPAAMACEMSLDPPDDPPPGPECPECGRDETDLNSCGKDWAEFICPDCGNKEYHEWFQEPEDY